MSEDYIQGDGVRFKRNPVGILPSCVIELDELRNEYKAKRSKALEAHGKTSDEYKKWDDAQKTVKRMRATLYGVTADKTFGWYDPDIAKTITYGGREALDGLVKRSSELGYKTLYGDTDSVMIALGDDLTPEECAQVSLELGEDLTAHMREKLQSDAIDVEPEMVMDRFLLVRKKRYAGRMIWMPDTGLDLMELDVQRRMKVTGIKMKQRKTAPIGKYIEQMCLESLWDDVSIDSVITHVKNYIESVRTDPNLNMLDLCGRASMKKSIAPPNRIQDKKNFHYSFGSSTAETQNPQYYTTMLDFVRAAAWHNIVLKSEEYPALEQGDTYYTTYVKDGPTWIPNGGMVAFHQFEQISEYELDIDKIIEKNIIDVLDNIMTTMGKDKSIFMPQKRRLKVSDFIEV